MQGFQRASLVWLRETEVLDDLNRERQRLCWRDCVGWLLLFHPVHLDFHIFEQGLPRVAQTATVATRFEAALSG